MSTPAGNQNAPTFQYLGREWQLCRQHRDRKRPEAEQATCAWYLRFVRPDNRKEGWKKIGEAHERPSDLIARAKAFLKHLDENRNTVDRFLDAVAERKSLTVATIVAEYRAAGCPDRSGRPRTGAALADQIKHLDGAVEYFGPRSPRTLGPADCLEFRTWKRARLTSKADGSAHAGARTCELDVAALSGCLNWAVLVRRIESNPLASRPALRDSEEIAHHHLYQPDNDEELHQLARWLFSQAEPHLRVAGAQVLVHAMTGLRAGEGACLQWPSEGRAHNAPGMRQLCRPDGIEVEWMHVRREKRGINPVVRVHPALRSFLEAWRRYCLTAHAGSPWMFPGVAATKAAPIDFTRSLNLAAEAIGSPSNRFQQTRRTAHALRGYYVSVRRDAGVPDALIAAELGQGGGDTLVRTTYGAPDAFASGRLDWMPREGIDPAWSVLRSETANVVAFKSA